MPKARPIPTVNIRPDRCKGCGICVAFCPTKVLGLDQEMAMVQSPEACVDCRLCELLCPDFAISLEKGDQLGTAADPDPRK